MRKDEVAKLLAYIGAFQPQHVDVLTVEAWSSQPVIQQISIEEANSIVQDFFASGEKWFSIQTIVNAVKERNRLQPWHVEADVRSAKSRGLIDTEWPQNKALPVTVADALAVARARDLAEARRFSELEVLIDDSFERA